VARRLQDEYLRAFLDPQRPSSLPYLRAISPVPLMRPDGSFACREGFDPGTGVFFACDAATAAAMLPPARPDGRGGRGRLPVPDGRAARRRARRRPQQAERLLLLLTLVMRAGLDICPLFIVEAGKAGTGKTTLVLMLAKAVLGAEPPAMPWSEDAEERRKALHTAAIEGQAVMVIDNLARGAVIDCPHIARAVTVPAIAGRVLGTNTSGGGRPPLLVATGNKVTAKGDIASRQVTIRLEATSSTPYAREYRHADVLAWVEADRARIVRAALTVLAANPGRTADGPIVSRFPVWEKVVARALQHAAGLAGEPFSLRDGEDLADAEEGEVEGVADALEALISLQAQGALPERSRRGSCARCWTPRTNVRTRSRRPRRRSAGPSRSLARGISAAPRPWARPCAAGSPASRPGSATRTSRSRGTPSATRASRADGTSCGGRCPKRPKMSQAEPALRVCEKKKRRNKMKCQQGARIEVGTGWDGWDSTEGEGAGLHAAHHETGRPSITGSLGRCHSASTNSGTFLTCPSSTSASRSSGMISSGRKPLRGIDLLVVGGDPGLTETWTDPAGEDQSRRGLARDPAAQRQEATGPAAGAGDRKRLTKSASAHERRCRNARWSPAPVRRPSCRRWPPTRLGAGRTTRSGRRSGRARDHRTRRGDAELRGAREPDRVRDVGRLR
jgi:hypothetical protein